MRHNEILKKQYAESNEPDNQDPPEHILKYTPW